MFSAYRHVASVYNIWHHSATSLVCFSQMLKVFETSQFIDRCIFLYQNYKTVQWWWLMLKLVICVMSGLPIQRYSEPL